MDADHQAADTYAAHFRLAALPDTCPVDACDWHTGGTDNGAPTDTPCDPVQNDDGTIDLDDNPGIPDGCLIAAMFRAASIPGPIPP